MENKEDELSEHKCECGKPLHVVRDKEGKILGVTHRGNGDEEHHYQHTENMMNAIKNNSN
jgi:hypothetical protein